MRICEPRLPGDPPVDPDAWWRDPHHWDKYKDLPDDLNGCGGPDAIPFED